MKYVFIVKIYNLPSIKQLNKLHLKIISGVHNQTSLIICNTIISPVASIQILNIQWLIAEILQTIRSVLIHNINFNRQCKRPKEITQHFILSNNCISSSTVIFYFHKITMFTKSRLCSLCDQIRS